MAKDNTQLKVKKSSQLKAIYLVAGDEEFMAYDHIQNLKALFLEKKDRSWESKPFDSKKGPLKDLLEEFYSVGIFAEGLGLHLKMNHDTFKKAQKSLELCWQQNIKERLLVIEISDWHYKARNSLNLSFAKKILDPADCLLHCRRLFDNMPPWGQYPWESELCQWSVKRAKIKYGLELGGKQSLALYERCGNDPGRIAGELEKIHLYMGNQRRVTEETIESLVPDLHASPISHLMDAFMSLNVKKIFKTLRHIENAGLIMNQQGLHQGDAQNLIILNQLQDTVRWILTAKRYSTRHGDIKQVAQNFLKEKPKLYSVSLGREDMNSRQKAEKLIKASNAIRQETLIAWHSLIHNCMSLGRQGKRQQNALFQLFVDMFEKKLVH